jgi:hypothetical protein
MTRYCSQQQRARLRKLGPLSELYYGYRHTGTGHTVSQAGLIPAVTTSAA